MVHIHHQILFTKYTINWYDDDESMLGDIQNYNTDTKLETDCFTKEYIPYNTLM